MDDRTIWLIIAVAAGVTNLLRAGPVLLFFQRGGGTPNGVFKFLEYASYVIIGSLISGSVVTPKALLSPSPASITDTIVAVVVVAFSFGLATRVRQPIVCLVSGLGLFLALRLLWPFI